MLVAVTPRPVRLVDPWLLRRVVQARRERQALRVLYQPMDQPEPNGRWISPVAFGSDGIRWHLRGYNHDAGRHEDMLFPRMVELDGERPAGEVPRDEDWERVVMVRLRPKATLGAWQRRVIEADYGMVQGEARLEVRAALLGLFLRRLGLDIRQPRERPAGFVEDANAAEVAEALKSVEAPFGAPPPR
jgi:predicted DNA-binding transcriptional regulator YafY